MAGKMPVVLAAIMFASLRLGASVPISETSAVTTSMSPIRKVITLVQEMKAQVEKEVDEDQIAYDKYMCWCETNEKEKTAAIKNAENQIKDLTDFIKQGRATEGELKTDIEALEKDIADDNEALADATGVRKQEREAFLAEEADMKETRQLLGEAIDVLSKVQLTQKGSVGAKEVTATLLQVRHVVERSLPKYSSVIKKDLFDVLGSLEEVSQRQLRTSGSGAFLSEQSALLPWEKTEEQVGMEAKANELEGAAANSKSYNSRSGQILGLLAEMRDEFSRDLSSAQRADFEAEVQFQQLRATKLAEIEAATKQKERKEQRLADLLDKIEKAIDDRTAMENAMDADQTFLANMRKSCKVEDDEYKSRVAVRTEEVRALAETLKILTADDARDLYSKTISLLQVAEARSASQDRAADRAMQRLVAVARRRKDWAFFSLATRVRLDAFEKVKKAMDKMMAQLQSQQKEEYAKWEKCKKDIDQTEDAIKEHEQTKEDLDEKHLDLTNTMDTLKKSISELKQEIAEMEVSLKQAGENRHEENQVFQAAVSDQRATINILQKALARLQQFYESQGALVQVQAHGRQEPGAAAPPPPRRPDSYSKSGGAGGVMQLLTKIIEDAGRSETALVAGENNAQQSYAEFARDTKESIEANRASIEAQSEQLAAANTERSETEEAQLANGQELETANKLLLAHHHDCDFLLKYFDVRQSARAEEMAAIEDAKAILSGADFGK